MSDWTHILGMSVAVDDISDAVTFGEMDMDFCDRYTHVHMEEELHFVTVGYWFMLFFHLRAGRNLFRHIL